MIRTTAWLAAIALGAACSTVRADYSVSDSGLWPDSWPKELEPLRKQARTLEGPVAPLLHYAIRFKNREEFESAWPHLLKVKSPGTKIVLRSAPSFWLEQAAAGICVHAPAEDDEKGTTYLELIVDGQIVDLNRIQLPPDTPIIDERFKEPKQ